MQQTAIIVDDEPVLREHLEFLLSEQWPELEIVGEAGDGEQAIALARKLQPDIAFLDIRMPGKSGLEAAASMIDICRVVFVTAFDEYAIEAFEKEAVDYLLKPVTSERLAIAVNRLQKDIKRDAGISDLAIRELMARLEQPDSAEKYMQWLRVGVGDGVRLLSIDDVYYFQAADKYTRVVTASGEELIRISIKKVMDSIDPEQFWRIHRATIVNVNCISHATRSFTGRYQVFLKNHDDVLTVSRTYGHLFKQM